MSYFDVSYWALIDLKIEDIQYSGVSDPGEKLVVEIINKIPEEQEKMTGPYEYRGIYTEHGDYKEVAYNMFGYLASNGIRLGNGALIILRCGDFKKIGLLLEMDILEYLLEDEIVNIISRLKERLIEAFFLTLKNAIGFEFQLMYLEKISNFFFIGNHKIRNILEKEILEIIETKECSIEVARKLERFNLCKTILKLSIKSELSKEDIISFFKQDINDGMISGFNYMFDPLFKKMMKDHEIFISCVEEILLQNDLVALRGFLVSVCKVVSENDLKFLFKREELEFKKKIEKVILDEKELWRSGKRTKSKLNLALKQIGQEKLDLKPPVLKILDASSEEMVVKEIPEDIILRIWIYGDDIVDKDSIVENYLENRIREKIDGSTYKTTLNLDRKDYILGIDVEKGAPVQYVPMPHPYINGMLLIFDIWRQESFNKIERWFSTHYKKPLKNLPVVLVGNKSDLESPSDVSKESIIELCNKYNIKRYYECSLKSKVSIERIFDLLIQDILKTY